MLARIGRSRYAVAIDLDRADKQARRTELGAFLRARRLQLQPEDVGLERRGHRRVAGLRREEVAQLAYVSVTWYAWLEQGRDFNPGGEALDAVCQVLQLGEDARIYVRQLAGHPEHNALSEPVTPSPFLTGVLEDLLPVPACLIGASFDLISWNAGFIGLFGDPLALPPEHRNIFWMFYLNNEVHQLVVDWPELARIGVALLRARLAKRPGDQRLRALIADLHTASADFREAWLLQEVRQSHSVALPLKHPVFGALNVGVNTMVANDDPAETIIVYYPTDAETRAHLPALIAASCGDAPFTSRLEADTGIEEYQGS